MARTPVLLEAGPVGRYPPIEASKAAACYVRNTSTLLKKSEIEVPRKSRFRAHRVVSTSSCHSRAQERVVRRNIGRSAELPRKFPSRLSAVFGIVIEAEIEFFNIG